MAADPPTEFADIDDAMKFLAAVPRVTGAKSVRVFVEKNAVTITGIVLAAPKPVVRKSKTGTSGFAQYCKVFVTHVAGFDSNAMAKVLQSAEGKIISATVQARVGKRVKSGEEGKTTYTDAILCLGDIIDVVVLRWGINDPDKFMAASLQKDKVYNLSVTPAFFEPPESPEQRPSYDAFVPKSDDDKGPLVGYTPLAKGPCEAIREMAKLCATVTQFDPRVGDVPRFGFAFFNEKLRAVDVNGEILDVANCSSYAVDNHSSENAHPWVSVISDSMAKFDKTWERAVVAFRSFGRATNPFALPAGMGDLGDHVRGFAVAGLNKDTLVDPDARRHAISMGVPVIPTVPEHTYVVVDLELTLRALASNPQKVLNEYVGTYIDVRSVADLFGNMRPADLPTIFAVARSCDPSDPNMQVLPLPTDVTLFYDIVSAANKEDVIKCKNLMDPKAPNIFAIKKILPESGQKRARDEEVPEADVKLEGLDDIFEEPAEPTKKKKKTQQ